MLFLDIDKYIVCLKSLDNLAFNILFLYLSRKCVTSSYAISWSKDGKFVERKEIPSFVCEHKWLYVINMQPLKRYIGIIQFKTSTPDYRLPNLILLIIIIGYIFICLKVNYDLLILYIKDGITISTKKVKLTCNKY